MCSNKQCLITSLGGMDYQPVQSRVSFPAFTTEGIFNITLQDDNIFEFNETFNVSMRLETPSVRVNIPNDTAVVTIEDDDRKCQCVVYISLLCISSSYHIKL